MALIDCPLETKSKFRVLLETTNTLVGICAVLIGLWWTSHLYEAERKGWPHANLEQTISHIPLSPNINLLRLSLKVTNTGSTKITIVETDLRIQQLLPLLPCSSLKPGEPCVREQITEAVNNSDRNDNHFSWPVISRRQSDSKDKSKFEFLLEPGETEIRDYEFAIPSQVKVIRAYSYLRNEALTNSKAELGWRTSSLYEFSPKRRKND